VIIYVQGKIVKFITIPNDFKPIFYVIHTVGNGLKPFPTN
jgi:hypothetical protein